MPDQTDDAAIEARFWKALRSDRTVMLGLADVDEGHTRPMTAQIDGDEDRGPIWFFGSSETELVGEIQANSRALVTFASKGHDVWAAVHGTLTIDNDPAVIDRLWNPYAAAWYEHGKDDPKLRLLRLDPERAQIWIDASNVLAGIKVMLGFDPKKDTQGKVAEVSLS